jgi:di/tricarboxylate transporter
MEDPACKEQYPLWIVVVANLVPLVMYGIGVYIFLRFSVWWVVAYLLFILLLEFRLISGHCTDCYYYGKTCAFGKGRLSARLFKKGCPERFSAMEITWKDIVPGFLLFLLPVIAGIWLLVKGFSWTVLVLVIAILLLGFAGNALVRGGLACRYCMQRKAGCPAERLFDSQKNG